MRRAGRLTLWGLMLSAAGPTIALAGPGVPGPAALRLAFNQNCYKPGDTLTASVIMENLGSPAAGFQAFLHYDATRLQFVSGSYTPTPFGLPVIFPIAASGGNINLASGINQLGGQSPTMASATLATLTFTALGDSGCLGNPGSFLTFRTNDPPTRVTDLDGQPLLPLTLTDSPPFGPGPGTLRLVYSQACYEPGHTVVVSVRMENICSPVSGFQAFLQFDTSKLQFVSGSYTSAPFGLPVIFPITASGANIDLASGIHQLAGQNPTTGDATLANLTFNVIAADECGGNPLSGVTFRPHDPPTRITNLCGAELAPLTLIDTPPVPAGPATLRLRFDKSCYTNGEQITAILRMEGLCDPAAGFQAFLSFDTSKMTFVNGNYTPVPFGLPVLPVIASGGNLDLASGIHQLIGQMPTTSDADLVILRFTAIAGGDCSTYVTLNYRPHDPPTRVTNICGVPLLPLTTITPPPIALDGVAPTITCPAPVTVQCPADVPPHATDRTSFLALPGTAVSDNCDPAPAVEFVSDVISGQTCANRYTITRTYKATDSCGNVNTCTQTITVNDTTPPTATCPPTLTVQCAADAPVAADLAAFITQGGTASDNCGGALSLQYMGDVITPGSCAGQYTITRTYRVLDVCGNFVDCEQTIHVNDTTPPVPTCPPGVTVQCPEDVPAPAADLAGFVGQGGTVSDNCGDPVTVQFVGDQPTPGDCPRHFTIARTYRVIDSCGNHADCTQTITVNDTTPPTLMCPLPVTVQCPSDVPPHATDLASFVGQGGSAIDNCAGAPVSVSFVDDVITGQTCLHRYTILRTHRGEDDCGNSTTCTQTITVNDTTAPIISCPPDVSAHADAGSCGAVVNPGVATATDNCDPAPAITFVREDGALSLSDPFSSSFNGSLGLGVTRITWTATDHCGNAQSCVQKVTVLPVNDLAITVELSPTINTGGTYPQTLDRCITLQFWGCPSASPAATVEAVMTFIIPAANAPAIANRTIQIPCGLYTCVTARDRLHTLRRTDQDDFGTNPIVGTQYVADFTNKTGIGGDNDALIGGNLNDDGTIDISDFGVFVGQYNTNYGTGNTTCVTPAPHADLSGNGLVFTEDFTFIQINFLAVRDANCCGMPLRSASTAGDAELDSTVTPRVSITVAELLSSGSASLAVADLNQDGVLDELDIAAWLQGARPGQPIPVRAPPRRR